MGESERHAGQWIDGGFERCDCTPGLAQRTLLHVVIETDPGNQETTNLAVFANHAAIEPAYDTYDEYARKLGSYVKVELMGFATAPEVVVDLKEWMADDFA